MSDNVNALLEAGLAHHEAGRLAEAEEHYRRVLDTAPTNAPALHLLGVTALQRDQVDVAIGLFSQALDHAPSAWAIHNNYGNALMRANRLDEARSAYQRAVELEPVATEALCNLAGLLMDLSLPAEAVPYFARACDLLPGRADLLERLGDAARDADNPNLAVAAYQRALAINPNFASVHNVLGMLLRANGYLDDAIGHYRRAIASAPELLEPRNNLANALQSRGDSTEAVAEFRGALALAPEHPALHYNYALSMLLAGEFVEAWDEYEWRYRVPQLHLTERQFDKPRWDGKPLKGGTLLLYAAGSSAETLQFIRFMPMVIRRGARVVVEVQPELKTLLEKSGLDISVVAAGTPLPPFDAHLALPSVPFAIRAGANLGLKPPYLRAEPAKLRAWKKRLGADLRQMRVGISWADESNHPGDRDRAIALSEFNMLAPIKGFSYYTLQKGPPAAQASDGTSALSLIDYTADLQDFADIAAMIENLDLVITGDTAIAHLAGALGRRVWVLLPFLPDWRWMQSGDATSWYPGARLFRQTKAGDWTGVIRRVGQTLMHPGGL